MMNGYDMTGWGWFGMAMTVIGTIAIVGLVAWASSRRPSDREPPTRTARERLDARLADGEIDTGEYRDRLEALRADHAHAP
jgi:uncharacterized membrane protein